MKIIWVFYEGLWSWPSVSHVWVFEIKEMKNTPCRRVVISRFYMIHFHTNFSQIMPSLTPCDKWQWNHSCDKWNYYSTTEQMQVVIVKLSRMQYFKGQGKSYVDNGLFLPFIYPYPVLQNTCNREYTLCPPFVATWVQTLNVCNTLH